MPKPCKTVKRRSARIPRIPLRATVGATTLIVFSLEADATQYSLEYGVETRYRYNDNVGLRPDDEVDVHGVQMSLPAKLTLADERYEFSADGEIASSKYDESGYNSDDQKLDLRGEYKFERGTLNANMGIDRDSTTQTAFLDNGVVGATADRVERYNAGTVGLYSLSQKYTAFTGLYYFENDYDTPRLVDNETAGGYVGLSSQYTEQTTLQLRANFSRFENGARLAVESDTVGFEAGFTTLYTERLTLSFLGGYNQVDTEYSADAGFEAPEDSDTSGWVVNTGVEYAGERSSIEGSFVRRETASADGFLIVSNQLKIDYRYNLTERSQIILEVIGGTSGALDEDFNNDRDYVSGSIRSRYRLTESWFLTGNYTYRYQDRERDPGDAVSNSVNIGILYKPNSLSWSR